MGRLRPHPIRSTPPRHPVIGSAGTDSRDQKRCGVASGSVGVRVRPAAIIVSCCRDGCGGYGKASWPAASW
jgi:hypothetical protein